MSTILLIPGSDQFEACITAIEEHCEMFAETGVDCLERGLELPRHRGIELADNRMQLQSGLVHIGNLRAEELVACASLLILLWRIRIAATYGFDAATQVINPPAQFSQLCLFFLRKNLHTSRKSPIVFLWRLCHLCDL